MIFDKNAKRIEELVRKDCEKHSARIAELRSRRPEWWIQYYDSARKNRAEKCPDEYQSKPGAKKYESIRKSELARGAFDLKDVRHVRIDTVVDAYLSEALPGKAGESSAKTLGGHIKRHIGAWWLDAIDRSPAGLVQHFRRFPEQWAPKYIYNYFIVLRAAINHWIRFRRLLMKNPCDLIRLDPATQILDYVPTEADLQNIITQSIVVGLPDWIRRLFIVDFETGRRINEVMRMQVEDCELSPESGLPFVWFWASKQKRKMRKPKPISSRCAEALREQVGERKVGDLWPVKNPPYKLLRESGLREAAGWPHRWFHDYRKSAEARFRISAGKEAAKGMLDHQTDSMAEWYTHYQRDDLEAAVKQSYTDQRTDQK